jgi:hypothetical protein
VIVLALAVPVALGLLGIVGYVWVWDGTMAG